MYLFTFLTFFLSSIWSSNSKFKQSNNSVNIFFFFAICWLIFHDGFRWGIGTDWDNYRTFFEMCLAVDIDVYDWGYVAFNQLIREITDNYTVFLVLFAVAQYGLFFYVIRKYSINPILTVFLFYCMMLPSLGMNRQFIAMAICLFSVRFILKRQFLFFIISIFFAALFHKSALLFIISYFLVHCFSERMYFILLLISIVVSISGIIDRIPLSFFLIFGETSFEKISEYTANTEKGSILFTILALAKRLIWLFFLFIYRRKYSIDSTFSYFFNIYFLATVLYVALNNSMLQIIVGRGLIYFYIAEIFLIPYILLLFKKNLTFYIIMGVIGLYCYINVEKGFNYYKEALGVDIFRPYNSVLMDDTYIPR
ncbi:EpsG family protein [uncultured Bacteroides sp.]|uniref:EpsG family protein n=1 Tax=uncultured Bacteroides sp. TaxID=162156 RepID=UPI0025D44484|nr:EpsG family protein [uncultured Bacteroides sp.]